jgi:hypothetical protein
MSNVNFASLVADGHQGGNPGGMLTLAVMLAKTFTGAWPVMADITDEEIVVAPRLAIESAWATYEFPDATSEVTSEKTGNPGFESYKHKIEYMFAGFSKTIQKELAKYLNAGAVFLVEMGDGQWVVVGSSKNPVYMKQSFKGGKKGSDPRGFTMKGEADGLMWDLLPLADAVVADLVFAPIV